ncbi:MAG: alanine racemase [Candidatus Doudnabacteria bacterium]|nr:alanine racemase [Candidatus Doudnabacteria bacterium]
MTPLTWIEVSQSALLHNAKQFRKVLKQTKLMAVVKSNAYGHGSFAVSETLESSVDWFGTANGTEALALRTSGIKKPILVLNYYDLVQVESLVARNVALVVYDLSQARAISKAAKKLKKKAKIHVKVGTGLSRLGIYARDAISFIKKVGRLPNIEIKGLFSHFASSEDDPTFTELQLGHFRNIIEDLENNLIFIPLKHIACTSSALAFPESRYDLARIGIGIYGLESYKSIHSLVTKINPGFNLRRVLTWKTKILAVKDLPAGAYVGYGRSYRTPRKTKLATLPVGYNEGYDRKLSNLGEVLVGGKRCKIRGRVYMNLLSVDVTDVKNIKAGDEAVLIGKQGKEEIFVDELANVVGTISYEIVTRINPTIPRVLVK